MTPLPPGTRRFAALGAVSVAVLAAVLAAGSVTADGDGAAPAGPEPEPEPSGVVEHVTVRLVEFPIVALDRDGGPVSHLSPGDLVVEVGGDPVEVAYVRPFRPEPDPDAARPTVRLGLDAGALSVTADTAEQTPRYYLLFLDFSSEPMPRGSDAEQALAGFLEGEIRPDDLVGVVSYAGELRLDLAFTPDRDLQLDALARAFASKRPTAITTRQRVQSLVRTLEQCEHISDTPFLVGEEREDYLSAGEDRPVAEEGCVNGVAESFRSTMSGRALRFLAALEGAVRFAATLRGGATILAVTHGATLKPESELLEAYAAVFGYRQVWKVQDAESSDPNAVLALDRLIRTGLDHGVTIHFLDPLPKPTGSRSARRGHLITGGTEPVASAHEAPRADLRHIAGALGGVLIADTDLLRGLQQVTLRERGRHVVGFYADRPLSDRDLRQIGVRARSAAVRIRTGRAYDVRRRTTLWSPGTILVGKAVDVEGGNGRRFVPFRLDALPSRLDYETVGDERVADLSLHVRVLTAGGRDLVDAYRFFRHAYPVADAPGGRVGVLAVRGWLEADPGPYRLEALFRNPRNGREVMILHELEIAEGGD